MCSEYRSDYNISGFFNDQKQKFLCLSENSGHFWCKAAINELKALKSPSKLPNIYSEPVFVNLLWNPQIDS